MVKHGGGRVFSHRVQTVEQKQIPFGNGSKKDKDKVHKKPRRHDAAGTATFFHYGRVEDNSRQPSVSRARFRLCPF